MKKVSLVLATAAILSIGISTSTQAAGPTSIAGAIPIGASLLTSLPSPIGGTIGQLSLRSGILAVPGLSSISLPLLGSLAALPVVSDISINQGVQTLQSISVLQTALPGLPSLP